MAVDNPNCNCSRCKIMHKLSTGKSIHTLSKAELARISIPYKEDVEHNQIAVI